MFQRRAGGLLIIGLSLAALLLVVATQQVAHRREFDQHRPDVGEPPGTVTSVRQSIGQTFTLTHDNFEAFEFRASQPQLVYDGKVKLRLLRGGTNGAAVPTQLTPTGGKVSFVLPDAPAGQYYVELTGSAADLRGLGVVTTLQDSYSGGDLLVDGDAKDGDFSFRITYRYYVWQSLGDTLLGVVGGLWPILCALLLYILPGRALLALLPLGALNFAQRIIAAPFVTLAALPLLLLWLKPTGLALGSWQMWLILVASAAVVIWDERRRMRQGDGWGDVSGWWAYVLLAVYIALAVAARLLTSATFAAGSGIDGYHHTLITQMIMERGTLPTDYQPYAPLASFTYHYGFHTLAAALGWLDGQDSVTLMLQSGQVLSALVAAALFVFVEKIWGNRLMALAAAYIVGFLAIFPSFYVNWSRYTQLAGLAVLPVAMLLLVIALRQPRLHWGSIALAVVVSGGLLLVHYRIFITYVTFVVLYALARVVGDVWQVARRKLASPVPLPMAVEGSDSFDELGDGFSPLPETPAGGFFPDSYDEHGGGFTILPETPAGGFFPALNSKLKTQNSKLTALPVWIPSLLIIGVASLLVVLPWLLNLRANFITRIVNNTGDATTVGFFDLVVLIGRQPLSYYSTWPLLVLVGLGAALMFARGDRFGWLLTAWVGLHTLLSNPYWQPIHGIPFTLRLPFAGLVDNVTLIQCSFVPGAIFAGYAVAMIIEVVMQGLRLVGSKQPPDARSLLRAGRLGFAAITLAGALAALIPLLGLIDPKPYVQAQDIAAGRWIGEHIPSASFVVSDFGFDWAPKFAQGSDAGLWLPLLGRPAGSAPPAQVPRSTAPPQPAYNEQLADPDYLKMTYDTTIASTNLSDEASWQTLQRYGVTHIYIGSRGGVLMSTKLEGNPHVQLVWHQDDVWVYQINY